jgi:hypothetical protein
MANPMSHLKINDTTYPLASKTFEDKIILQKVTLTVFWDSY